MISVSISDDSISVRAGELPPRIRSQLAFWGFTEVGDRLVAAGAGAGLTARAAKVVAYLERRGCSLDLDEQLRAILTARENAKEALERAKELGSGFKQYGHEPPESSSFRDFLARRVDRKLKPHQVKAALHSLAVGGGANFSVPGSGKTTVVLSVFGWMREQGRVDSLFVLGPPACFGPWVSEYIETFGQVPNSQVLAGGDIAERHSSYWVNQESLCDLYLTSFQTLCRDVEHVSRLFRRGGVRFFFVVDEAHYIKRADGVWAAAALEVAEEAEVRCILTGTPFPHSLTDAFNLFDVVWPDPSPLPSVERTQISVFCDQQRSAEATSALDRLIGPLFYRVRKRDLGLAPQKFSEPIVVEMKEHERRIYNAVSERVAELSKSDFERDWETLVTLRRARMIRLRQCVSNAALLKSAIGATDEEIIGGDASLGNTIARYDQLETPAKLEALLTLVSAYHRQGRKVVVWTNFIGSLERIKAALVAKDIRAELIFGATPLESSGVEVEVSREGIIREFIRQESGLDVLIANPAACAESISLHKTCSNAVYYDLSYNCAQYLQSLDRIHRVGGSEEVIAHYDFLQYRDTIDADILKNVREKADRMSNIIDREYPVYSLDMFADDDELDAYDRLFDA